MLQIMRELRFLMFYSYFTYRAAKLSSHRKKGSPPHEREKTSYLYSMNSFKHFIHCFFLVTACAKELVLREQIM